MTSNMIKNSLAELREKLTQMRHNKQMVDHGLSKLDEMHAAQANSSPLRH